MLTGDGFRADTNKADAVYHDRYTKGSKSFSLFFIPIVVVWLYYIILD